MQDEAVLALLTSMDAIVEKKVKLSDGRTTDVFIELGIALQHPDIVSDFAEQMATDFFTEDIDVVVSGAVSGVLLGHEIARQLEARHIPATYDDKGNIEIRDIYNLEKKEKVLIVDDVINTGIKIDNIRNILKKTGVTVKGIVCVVDRAEKPIKSKPEIRSLLALRLPVNGVEKTSKKSKKTVSSEKKTVKKSTASKKKTDKSKEKKKTETKTAKKTVKKKKETPKKTSSTKKTAAKKKTEGKTKKKK